jgi:cardiolipin synthase
MIRVKMVAIDGDGTGRARLRPHRYDAAVSGPTAPAAGVGGAPPSVFSDRILTVPNAITLVRLACLPVFVWLLLGRDDPVAAGWLLGILGATDWVDGWIARRFHQGSELGKVLDPVADRLLFIVSMVAIIIDGGVPRWFCVLVLLREALVGAAMVVATLLGMQRFGVTWWGKLGTFLLMFAIPGLLIGTGDAAYADLMWIAGWVLGLPGLVISWYAAAMYIPTIRANLAAGRTARREHR